MCRSDCCNSCVTSRNEEWIVPKKAVLKHNLDIGNPKRIKTKFYCSKCGKECSTLREKPSMRRVK